MSGYSADLEKGKIVLHRGKKKIVSDWYFVSNGGCHNSDLIVIIFKDGTSTGDEGFSNIKDYNEK